jgi:hypothetical protein
MLSGTTMTCALGSFIHAFFPFLFVTHTSTTIRKLQDIFDARERELAKPAVENYQGTQRSKKRIMSFNV